MGKQLARKQRIVRITGAQRDDIDPHMIAQILLDLAGQEQARIAASEDDNAHGFDLDLLAREGSEGEHPQP